jgi:hypothetical protein
MLESLKALDCFFERADMTLVGEARHGFFDAFLVDAIVHLLALSCEPQGCIAEVSNLLSKLCNLVGSGKVGCQLFSDGENADGVALCVGQRVVEEHPLCTVGEIAELMRIMMEPRAPSDFDAALAMFVARAKQTTPGETLRHLSVQRVREAVRDMVISMED